MSGQDVDETDIGEPHGRARLVPSAAALILSAILILGAAFVWSERGQAIMLDLATVAAGAFCL